MASSSLPVNVIKEAFHLDGSIVVWRKRPLTHFSTARGCTVFNSRYAGLAAGTLLSPRKEYKIVWITYLGQKFQILEHIVVWVLVYGCYPDGEVDHRDGNGLNNNPENLRVGDRTSNMHNKAQYVSNTSGHTRVSWYRRYNMWVAQGTHKGTKETLGYFHAMEDAVAARKEWEVGKNFSRRHGKTCDEYGNPAE